MCWERQRDAPCEPSSAGGARRTVRGWLREAFPGQDGEELVDDAELVTSELTANAVNAGCDILGLRLTVHDEWLEVALRDDAAGDPKLRPASPAMSSGRGLMIVEAVSLAWGVDHGPDGGKLVWSRLAVPAELTPVDEGCRWPKPPTVDSVRSRM